MEFSLFRFVGSNAVHVMQHLAWSLQDLRLPCRLAMKESKGRMNPGVMNKLLAEKLKG